MLCVVRCGGWKTLLVRNQLDGKATVCPTILRAVLANANELASLLEIVQEDLLRDNLVANQHGDIRLPTRKLRESTLNTLARAAHAISVGVDYDLLEILLGAVRHRVLGNDEAALKFLSPSALTFAWDLIAAVLRGRDNRALDRKGRNCDAPLFVDVSLLLPSAFVPRGVEFLFELWLLCFRD